MTNDRQDTAEVSEAHVQDLADSFDHADPGELPGEEAPDAAVERPRLPRRLKRLFWEYDFSKLRWEEDRDLVIGRILSRGDWESVSWLLAKIGRKGLRRWLMEHQARGLDARRLRFWELILKLPHRTVTQWIEAGDGPWTRRMGR